MECRVAASLGVTTKLSDDGRTMLRGSYGRFSQGVLTGEFGSVHPAVSPVTTNGFDPATGGYTRRISVVDGRLNLLVDSDTRAPRTDDIDRSRSRNRSPGRGIDRLHPKEQRNFIGWEDIGGQYREVMQTIAPQLPVFTRQPASGSALPVDESGQLLDDIQRPRHGR